MANNNARPVAPASAPPINLDDAMRRFQERTGRRDFRVPVLSEDELIKRAIQKMGHPDKKKRGKGRPAITREGVLKKISELRAKKVLLPLTTAALTHKAHSTLTDAIGACCYFELRDHGLSSVETAVLLEGDRHYYLGLTEYKTAEQQESYLTYLNGQGGNRHTRRGKPPRTYTVALHMLEKLRESGATLPYTDTALKALEGGEADRLTKARAYFEMRAADLMIIDIALLLRTTKEKISAFTRHTTLKGQARYLRKLERAERRGFDIRGKPTRTRKQAMLNLESITSRGITAPHMHLALSAMARGKKINDIARAKGFFEVHRHGFSAIDALLLLGNNVHFYNNLAKLETKAEQKRYLAYLESVGGNARRRGPYRKKPVNQL